MRTGACTLFPAIPPESWQPGNGVLLSAAHSVDYAPPLSLITRHNTSGPCHRAMAAPARQRQELRARNAWLVPKNLELKANLEEPRCGHVC